MKTTPNAERTHIAFFGVRNAGKSSLVNAVTAQTVSVVSDTPGTTTDPVSKSMELLPLGPVVIIDTPGIDDEGALGEARVARTKEVLRRADIAVLVTDATRALQGAETELLAIFKERDIPCLLVCNKADLRSESDRQTVVFSGKGDPEQTAGANKEAPKLFVSALTGEGIHELKERLASLKQDTAKDKCIVADLLQDGDTVILVTPIDASAPKGRLILPQQLVLRELLDYDHAVFVTKETTYPDTLQCLKTPPALVITDSQVFEQIDAETPPEIALTSFSILMARYKGTLEASLKGAYVLDQLQDEDKILIAEGCTHHRQCEDIGTVKLPKWIERYSGKQPHYDFTSGGTFPSDLSPYRLIVHCGGCMLNDAEMLSRMQIAENAGIPMTNYGLAIAQMHGILKRSTAML